MNSRPVAAADARQAVPAQRQTCPLRDATAQAHSAPFGLPTSAGCLSFPPSVGLEPGCRRLPLVCRLAQDIAAAWQTPTPMVSARLPLMGLYALVGGSVPFDQKTHSEAIRYLPADQPTAEGGWLQSSCPLLHITLTRSSQLNGPGRSEIAGPAGSPLHSRAIGVVGFCSDASAPARGARSRGHRHLSGGRRSHLPTNP